MRAGAVATALVTLAACRFTVPEFDRCSLQCQQGACPAGLECHGDGYCHQPDDVVGCPVGGIDGPPRADGAADSPRLTVTHVPSAEAMPGTADLEVASEIDTTTLLIDGAAPPIGVRFVSVAQTEGPDVAVLAVSRFDCAEGSPVRVVGQRALVIIAGGDVGIACGFDAGARLGQPGAGGAAGGLGQGAGLPGTRNMPADSAGGGGAFGALGEAGGDSVCAPMATGALGGTTYGDADLSSLVGGSGGGAGSHADCPESPGGAGGGAVQISSFSRILVAQAGGLHAGGGGGGGGAYCGPGDSGAGSGGGSGGAIYLEAVALEIHGAIAANGGAGGGGSIATAMGGVGEDAQMGVIPAVGGGVGGTGGSGGYRDAAAAPGADSDSCSNGPGGGGGGVGRIVLRSPTVVLDGAASPAPTMRPF